MSFHKKLQEVDDGSFDELLKKIEQQTEDKAEREKLLTEIVLQNFMRRCALNSQKGRENLKPSSGTDLIPEKLKSYIENIQASEPMFVIEKRLTNSDLNETSQGRLSIPESKINADQFLGKQEIEKLNKDGALPVTLIEIGTDPVVETNLRLKKWKTNYGLTEKWNVVKRRNEEKFKSVDGVNAVIQLWSFRHKSRLYFALNVVEEEAKTGVAITNGNNGGGSSSSLNKSNTA
ncbi:uncharacterized protein LOC111277530 [Durio zibethinus]|uniref:Uncharacterized protein LOC111277530 n=1 Tax=Durio zibethinus TaxID=66656 RepID=A0A6P5WV31_DURZI|nr:uncharacterized protein LOC111277530 [Durio zibethinus]